MPVIVRPILELDADDVRTATSLYKVNACSRNLHHEKKNTKEITIDGKPYFINIEEDYRFRDKNTIQLIVFRVTDCFKGFLIYVNEIGDIITNLYPL